MTVLARRFPSTFALLLCSCSIAPSGDCFSDGFAHCDTPQIDTAGATTDVPPCGDTSATVCIDGGPFTRGGRGYNVDYPAREIWISTFEIDVREVSIAEYRLCEATGTCAVVQHANPDDRPAEVVWDAAATYCAWRRARLATEAEWEKSARGDADTRSYPWGDAEPTCDRMNWASCEDPPALRATDSDPSGASPYGLLHMSGNAAEWVSDRTTDPALWRELHLEYDMNSPDVDPQGPALGPLRTYKGGGYLDTDPAGAHIAKHGAADPLARALGFRCAHTP